MTGHCRAGKDIAHPCPEPVAYEARYPLPEGDLVLTVCAVHGRTWQREGWTLRPAEGGGE